MGKKNKLYEMFVEAAMDAHVGWLLWEVSQAEMDNALGRPPKPVTHTSDFNTCQKDACVDRRKIMKDYD